MNDNTITPADIAAFEKVLRHRFQEDVILALEEDGMAATPDVIEKAVDILMNGHKKVSASYWDNIDLAIETALADIEETT